MVSMVGPPISSQKVKELDSRCVQQNMLVGKNIWCCVAMT